MLKIENNTLTVHGLGAVVAMDLLPLDAGSTVHVWHVPAAYRANGVFASAQIAKQPQEVPACDLAACTYLGAVDYPACPELQLGAAKKAKVLQANALCDAAVATLTATYPQAEIQSWPQQVKEADAFLVDSSADVPLLTAIAAQRELGVHELVERVHAKVTAYAQASGYLIGKRQALEDAIDAAASLQELDAIALSA